MEKFIRLLMSIGPAVPRIGLSGVFLWFGIQQFQQTEAWVGYVPEFIVSFSGISAATLVHFNGAFEMVFGTALLFGIATRVTALLFTLHLAHITSTVGINSIGIRDIGLTAAIAGVFLHGADPLCLDVFIERVLASKPSTSTSSSGGFLTQ